MAKINDLKLLEQNKKRFTMKGEHVWILKM